MIKEASIRKNGIAKNESVVHVDMVDIDGVETKAINTGDGWLVPEDLAYGLFIEQASDNTEWE